MDSPDWLKEISPPPPSPETILSSKAAGEAAAEWGSINELDDVLVPFQKNLHKHFPHLQHQDDGLEEEEGDFSSDFSQHFTRIPQFSEGTTQFPLLRKEKDEDEKESRRGEQQHERRRPNRDHRRKQQQQQQQQQQYGRPNRRVGGGTDNNNSSNNRFRGGHRRAVPKSKQGADEIDTGLTKEALEDSGDFIGMEELDRMKGKVPRAKKKESRMQVRLPKYHMF